MAAFCASSFSSRTWAASASAARMPAVSAPRAASRLTVRARFDSTARDPSHAAPSTITAPSNASGRFTDWILSRPPPNVNKSRGCLGLFRLGPPSGASHEGSRTVRALERRGRYGAAISFWASGTICPPDGIFSQPAVCSVRA